jgi:hypothetical protein
MAEQHVILGTHTTLHLGACLAGFAAQTRPPETVTLSCDVDKPEILEAVREATAGGRLRVAVVMRPHTGMARCSQVRNNGVRAVMSGVHGRAPAAGSRLIFLDGDTVPSATMVSDHERIGGADRLVSTYRVNLTEGQTERFDGAALSAGREPVELTPSQRDELRTRQARYARQAMWRRLGLGKPHKPRLIGGHFSVPLAAYVDVNGCDEAYEGYGQEDDDLTRRLYRAGWRSVVAVDRIVVYHLWHPTRAPGDWHEAPGVKRFGMATPTRCGLGLDRPAAQGAVRAWVCEGGRSREVEAGLVGRAAEAAVV